MLGKLFVESRFIVNKAFHSDGDKRVGILIMLPIQVCVRVYFWVEFRLT